MYKLAILLLVILSKQYACLSCLPNQQQNVPYQSVCGSGCHVILLQAVFLAETFCREKFDRALYFIFLHAPVLGCVQGHVARLRTDRRPIHFAQSNLAPQVLVRPWHSGASSDSIKDSGCHPSIFDAFPRPQAYTTECESPRTSKQCQA